MVLSLQYSISRLSTAYRNSLPKAEVIFNIF